MTLTPIELSEVSRGIPTEDSGILFRIVFCNLSVKIISVPEELVHKRVKFYIADLGQRLICKDESI